MLNRPSGRKLTKCAQRVNVGDSVTPIDGVTVDSDEHAAVESNS